MKVKDRYKEMWFIVGTTTYYNDSFNQVHTIENDEPMPVELDPELPITLDVTAMYEDAELYMGADEDEIIH